MSILECIINIFYIVRPAPEAPLRVDVVSAGQRTVVIKVIDPFLWNGSPVGYRVKWLPKQRPDGSGEDFYKIPSSRHSETFNITLNLEPGESYQVFVFAVNTDNTKATYEGPATTTHVGTTPMGKQIFKALRWHWNLFCGDAASVGEDSRMCNEIEVFTRAIILNLVVK